MPVDQDLTALEAEDRLVTTQSDVTSGSPENTEVSAQTEEELLRPQPSKLESFFAITKSLIIRALIVYFITSMFRQSAPPKADLKSPSGGVRGPSVNMFNNGTKLDMYCYISEREFLKNFEDADLIWKHTGLIYGDWYGGENGDGTFTYHTNITPSHSLKHNGSIYLHVYLVKSGNSPDPRDKELYAGHFATYSKKVLNKYKKLYYQKTHNLLTGQTEKSEEEVRKAETVKNEIVSHWHPNLTINLVTDQTNWMQGSVPPPLDEFIYFLPDGKYYKPAVFLNDYWNMMRDYVPINETTETLELHLTYQPLSLFKWQLYTAQAMRDKLSMFSALGGEEQDEEQDTVKELLLDTSPYLLALTITVSILHSIFELLAFKNDIQFWNNRQSLEGLSVRSVFFNVFQSTIVLLYVLDNETNVMVRISCFIGLIIEIWKINKVMDVKLNRDDKILGLIPKLTFKDKDIVFFIFLYQRWIYKVDHKRVNEFGFSGEMEQIAKNGTPAITESDKKND
ncbi:Cleft lip and palate transmembrane protein 1 homolog [Eumeta japonica]|uniref:Cleft lip and palate transmembrane protein 1 homolog n=1 Tax=Eumeta variegata TaxID=151549 RepID=A0A4C1VQR0_EUMVA|nr:Cleft lip and palate transmembrane protein 1 homolog [Eumeta japonica]